MGDTLDGSSSAAQRAQDPDPSPKAGLLQRFLTRNRPGKTPTNGHPAVAPLPLGGTTNLTRLRVEDVAVPRADIVAVPDDIDLKGLLKVFKDSAYSRLPVFSDVMDNPAGLIHLKDIALKYGFNGSAAKFSLKRNLRPLLFAPPSMPIGVLLQKMQSERTHMALVIDEYGGVDGLVTIEDLVEQVVGDITDEHDQDEAKQWVEESPGVWLVQARAELDDFEAALGAKLLEDAEDEEIGTLGGLVFMLIGRVPAKGEIIQHPAGFDFQVVDADPRRIKRLRISRTEQE